MGKEGMKVSMAKEIVRAVLVLVVLTLLTGVVYPLAVTGLAQVLFPGRANGSLVKQDGRLVGSALIAQGFGGAGYFHPRPSAAGNSGYDARASGGSNLGPTSRRLYREVGGRVAAVRQENGLPSTARIPSDLVTASASGLDPDLSPEAALLQVRRVAKARGLNEGVVRRLVLAQVRDRQFRILGQPRVNVLGLNLALDRLR